MSDEKKSEQTNDSKQGGKPLVYNPRTLIADFKRDFFFFSKPEELDDEKGEGREKVKREIDILSDITQKEKAISHYGAQALGVEEALVWKFRILYSQIVLGGSLYPDLIRTDELVDQGYCLNKKAKTNIYLNSDDPSRIVATTTIDNFALINLKTNENIAVSGTITITYTVREGRLEVISQSSNLTTTQQEQAKIVESINQNVRDYFPPGEVIFTYPPFSPPESKKVTNSLSSHTGLAEGLETVHVIEPPPSPLPPQRAENKPWGLRVIDNILRPFYALFVFFRDFFGLIAVSNSLIIFSLLAKHVGRVAIDSWAKYVFFPLAAVADIFGAIAAYRQAQLQGFKNASLNRNMVLEGLAALAITLAVTLSLLAGAGVLALSTLVASLMFTSVLGFKTLSYLVKACFELFQSLVGDAANRQQYRRKAFDSAITSVSLGLVTFAALMGLVLGTTALGYLGVIGAAVGLVYVSISLLITPPALPETARRQADASVAINAAALDSASPAPRPLLAAVVTLAFSMAAMLVIFSLFAAGMGSYLAVFPGALLFVAVALLEITMAISTGYQAFNCPEGKFKNASLNRKLTTDMLSALTLSVAVGISLLGGVSLALAAPIMFIMVLGFRGLNTLIDLFAAGHKVRLAQNAATKEEAKQETIDHLVNLVISGLIIVAVIGVMVLHVQAFAFFGIAGAACGVLYMGYLGMDSAVKARRQVNSYHTLSQSDSADSEVGLEETTPLLPASSSMSSLVVVLNDEKGDSSDGDDAEYSESESDSNGLRPNLEAFSPSPVAPPVHSPVPFDGVPGAPPLFSPAPAPASGVAGKAKTQPNNKKKHMSAPEFQAELAAAAKKRQDNRKANNNESKIVSKQVEEKKPSEKAVLHAGLTRRRSYFTSSPESSSFSPISVDNTPKPGASHTNNIASPLPLSFAAPASSVAQLQLDSNGIPLAPPLPQSPSIGRPDAKDEEKRATNGEKFQGGRLGIPVCPPVVNLERGDLQQQIQSGRSLLRPVTKAEKAPLQQDGGMLTRIGYNLVNFFSPPKGKGGKGGHSTPGSPWSP